MAGKWPLITLFGQRQAKELRNALDSLGNFVALGSKSRAPRRRSEPARRSRSVVNYDFTTANDNDDHEEQH